MNPNGIFATNNTDPNGIDVTGTTLQGQVRCTYTDLVHAFGTPIDEPTAFIWLVRFNDFTVAKVYGVKETELPVYWDVDGFDNTAFIRVSGAVQRSLKEAV
jgi:hypothetical protein